MSSGTRARRPKMLVQVTSLVILAWGLMTMGSVMAGGAMPDFLTGLLPALALVTSVTMAFGVFLAGALVVVLIAALAAQVLIRPSRAT